MNLESSVGSVIERAMGAGIGGIAFHLYVGWQPALESDKAGKAMAGLFCGLGWAWEHPWELI